MITLKETTLNKLTVHRDQLTATGDNAFALGSAGEIFNGIIYCKTNNALLGDSSNQTFPLNASDSISVERIDLSTIYAKNADAGVNIVLELIGGLE